MTNIQLKRGNKADWTSKNPILQEGEVGIELDTDRLKIGDGTKHWNDLEYSDKKLTDITSKNADDIARLKTIVGDNEDDVFIYRGKAVPTYPVSAKKAYYLSFYALSNNMVLQLPTGNLELGTIVLVANEDNADSIRIMNQGTIESNLPSRNIAFLIKTNEASEPIAAWDNIFSGVVPSSMHDLISTIKASLVGSLNTIPEIEAALKDKLHTFREIQTEFSDQLHTFNDIENDGFIKGIDLTDGTRNILDVKKITVSGATVGGYPDNATLNITGGTSGIEISDGVNDLGGIKKLNVTGMKVESTNPTDANLKSYTEIMTLDDAGNPTQFTGQGHVIEVNPPLRAYPSNNADDTLTLEIKHNAFEKVHIPGFLGYLDQTESILPRIKDENKYFKGALFFNDIVKDKGSFIVVDRDKKAYGIQEYDGLDPNISGGNDYLVVFRAAMLGTAPRDGNVRLELVKKDASPSDTDLGYIKDKNGNPIVVERSYKQGEHLGVLEATGIVNATGLQEFKCIVSDTFQHGEVILGDRTNGGTGLLIQCLTSEYKTGDALQQFELDTQQNLEYSSYYLGADIIDFKADFTYPVPNSTLTAGTEVFKTHNSHLVAFDKLMYGQGNNHLNIKDDGISTAFSLDQIINNEKSQILKGKPMKFSVTMTNDNSDFDAYICKYTGNPDDATDSIITGLNGDGSPIFRAGWSEVEQFSIGQTQLGTDVTTTHTLTLPTDVSINNFGFFIKPTRATFPFEAEIGNLNAECTSPFIGYYMKTPQLVEEAHLLFDDEYKEFSMDNAGNESLRFTINDNETLMPAGTIQKGNADIGLNDTVEGVAATDLTYGRGGIKFNKSGAAKINTDLRIFSEKPNDTTVSFWWEIYNQGAANYKIPESETTFTVRANSKDIAYSMKEFTWDATSGMVFLLKAQASEQDGAFLQSNIGGHKLVTNRINFKVLGSGGSSDEPIETLYTKDALDEVWEVKTSTDGHIETLKDGDVPENIVHHVTRDNFDRNSFELDSDGGISLKNEQAIIDRLARVDDEIIITEAAREGGWYIELDYDPVTGRPSLAPKQRQN